MADKKISALTAATTPLAGTEVLPIVQSGSTVKVAVSDLTAGRSVSMSGFTSAGNGNFSSGNVHIAKGNGVFLDGNLSYGSGVYSDALGTSVKILAGSTDRVVFEPSGNIVPQTAAKGVNFTANTPAAGMTSQLLNWYEEGTWTPTLGGTATYTAQSGKYTRIGRVVYFSGDLTVNVLGTGSLNAIDGLPFSAAGNNAVFVGYFANLAVSPVSMSPFVGGTAINIYGLTAAAATATGLNIFGNGARLMFSGFYEV